MLDTFPKETINEKAIEMATIPKCPYCQTQGIKNIASQKAGPLRIIFCGNCGAIFTIIPDALLQEKPRQQIAPATEPAPEQKPETEPDIEPLTPEQIMGLGFYGQSTQYMKFPVIDKDE